MQPDSSNRHTIESWVVRFVRWILAAIFFYAGITKLFDPVAFATIIEAYGILPDALVMPVAVILPVVEVAAAIGLLFDFPGSLICLSILLLLFMAILGYGIYLGLDVDCGCFSPHEPEYRAYSGLREAFFRDVLMMLGVLYLYLWRFRSHASGKSNRFTTKRSTAE